ncbi:MAG: hypothetical protein CMK59_00770 [Proteobacteria bacterium]|nr:hypothetical protein [Pseudomonadota bacterium]
MKAIYLLTKRELGYHLNTLWGYALIAFVLLIDGLLFNSFSLTDTARYSSDVLEDFFYFSSGTTMIAGIFLSMRLFAEERQSNTIVLLETTPINEAQVVAGKFLGALVFLMLITLLTLYMPIFIQINGKVSWSQIATGYLGLFSLASVTISIGLLGSTMAKNQLFAAIIGAGILVLFLLGWLMGKIAESPLNEIFSYIALFDRHYQPFMRGRINTESLFFYISVSFLFLLLATRILQTRRQS